MKKTFVSTLAFLTLLSLNASGAFAQIETSTGDQPAPPPVRPTQINVRPASPDMRPLPPQKSATATRPTSTMPKTDTRPVTNRMGTSSDRALNNRAEERREHFANLATLFGKRFMAAYERLIDIHGRIQKHINDLSLRGVDTVPAQAALDKAKPLMEEALVAIEALKKTFEGLKADPSNETLRNDLREKADAAKKALQAAHRALMDVIPILKSAAGLQRATTTPDTN